MHLRFVAIDFFLVGALIRITAHVLLQRCNCAQCRIRIRISQPPRHSEGPGPSREQISLQQQILFSPVLKSILSELQGLKAEMKKMKTEQEGCR